MTKKISVVVLGASGYTGAELLRLLVAHPNVTLSALTADKKAGRPMGDVFHHLAGAGLPDLVRADDVDWAQVDLAFCCLPHGTTQQVIAELPQSVKVVDLSADFRLADVDTYAQWYGHEHLAPLLQSEAVYGLSELASQEIAAARLVANPGCYPTACLLPLMPLLSAGLIDHEGLIIDAKSGVSGAGRAARQGSLYTEVAGGIHAYEVSSHRHLPEIEQGLSRAAGQEVMATFTPHLIPMSRGILATIYARAAAGKTADDLRAHLAGVYEGEPFVQIMEAGQIPSTRDVKGTNQCRIAVADGRSSGDIILLCVIDNLVKGAAGQAVANMNLMFAFPRDQGLNLMPLFP